MKVILRALCDQGCLDIYKFSKYCPRNEYDRNKQIICHLEKVLDITQSNETYSLVICMHQHRTSRLNFRIVSFLGIKILEIVLIWARVSLNMVLGFSFLFYSLFSFALNLKTIHKHRQCYVQ